MFLNDTVDLWIAISAILTGIRGMCSYFSHGKLVGSATVSWVPTRVTIPAAEFWVVSPGLELPSKGRYVHPQPVQPVGGPNAWEGAQPYNSTIYNTLFQLFH